MGKIKKEDKVDLKTPPVIPRPLTSKGSCCKQNILRHQTKNIKNVSYPLYLAAIEEYRAGDVLVETTSVENYKVPCSTNVNKEVKKVKENCPDENRRKTEELIAMVGKVRDLIVIKEPRGIATMDILKVMEDPVTKTIPRGLRKKIKLIIDTLKCFDVVEERKRKFIASPLPATLIENSAEQDNETLDNFKRLKGQSSHQKLAYLYDMMWVVMNHIYESHEEIGHNGLLNIFKDMKTGNIASETEKRVSSVINLLLVFNVIDKTRHDKFVAYPVAPRIAFMLAEAEETAKCVKEEGSLSTMISSLFSRT